jgi:23S rRNA (guanine745-N1)-methyltransferase
MSTESTVRPLCTVRGCAETLERGPRAWSCARGHSFDVARSGYVNLLQPGDRRSRAAGDAREAIEARARLEDGGFHDELYAALAREVAALAPARGSAALDVGACTGRLLEHVCATAGLAGWALDLSIVAADLGARRRGGLTWVVANADRGLPFADGSFELLISSAGPKNPAEFRRVLAAGGALLLVVPGADDLIELRGELLGEGRRIDRVGPALERFGEGFAVVGRTAVSGRRRLGRAQVEDVLAAAYRAGRRRERERLEKVGEIEVTIAAEVLRLVGR